MRHGVLPLLRAMIIGCLPFHLGALGSGAAPSHPPGAVAPPPPRILEIQVALVSRGFRVGPIDGVDGPRTQAALRAFQQSTTPAFSPGSQKPVHPTLSNGLPAWTRYVVTTEDIDALGPVPPTWLGKSTALRLPYQTLLEAMAERSASHPKLIRQLNPHLTWNRVPPGTGVILPRFQDPPIRPAARVSIHLKSCTLLARDAAGRVILMAPCSIGRRTSSRPVGNLRVVSIVRNPTYTFDPARFPDSPEARSLDRKLLLPPGPNNPVGVAWIGLDRPGIGIHGTPSPETVGRPESHGCFRLANWDAAYLAQVSWPGLPVEVVDRD